MELEAAISTVFAIFLSSNFSCSTVFVTFWRSNCSCNIVVLPVGFRFFRLVLEICVVKVFFSVGFKFVRVGLFSFRVGLRPISG